MKDAAIRALRTFVQAFLGTFAVIFIPWATRLVRAISSAEPYELDFNTVESAAIAGALAAVIALVSFIQNELEDRTGKTALK